MSAFRPCPKRTDWKGLYRAALRETDTSVIAGKVSEAEAAILARGREIFNNDATMDEKDELEEALYLLRAFKTACESVKSALIPTEEF